MAADRTGRVWDEVRRALGKLVGRVASHALPDVESGIGVSVRQLSSLQVRDVGAGMRQAECRPSTLVRELPPPVAPAGGGGANLATVATVIGADRALRAGDVPVSAMPYRFAGAAVQSGDLGYGLQGVPKIHALPMRFTGTPAPKTDVVVNAPSVRSLPVIRAALPKPSRTGGGEWQLAPVRTRTGLAPILRVPMVCRRLSPPPRIPSDVAFEPERLLLAATAGVPPADVALIGVFPHVPLGAVLRLALSPDGKSMQILVRPDALGGRTPVATVTVVLGRQRSTGKMLQAVRRGTAPGRC